MNTNEVLSNIGYASVKDGAMLYGVAKHDLFPDATFSELRFFKDDGFEYDFFGVTGTEWE